jgi:hypothetical protein
MRFLEAYKKLDNLCKDIYENGVSSYINEMDKNRYDYSQIANWDLDYQNLKRYRYIRNQIVHQSNVYESDLTNENDIRWIEDFYQRILRRTDPLALLHQKRVALSQQRTVRPTEKNESEKLVVKSKRISLISKIISFFHRNK